MIAVHEEIVDVIFVIRGDAGFPRRYCVLRQGTAQHGPDPFGQQKVRARLANEIIRTRFSRRTPRQRPLLWRRARSPVCRTLPELGATLRCYPCAGSEYREWPNPAEQCQ